MLGAGRAPVLALVLLAVFAGCAARRPVAAPCPPPDLSAIPEGGGARALWGAYLTKVEYLDAAGSRPAVGTIVTQPGTLAGRWLGAGPPFDLRVEPMDPTGGTDVGRRIFGPASDYFRLRVDDERCRAELPFRAAYGEFRLFAMDLDGDGVDEAVLERGDAGLGPYSYRRRLQIFRVALAGGAPPACRFLDVFETSLTGLGMNGTDMREVGVTIPILAPHGWLRRYRFTGADAAGRVGLELCVVRGDARPAPVGSTDWTAGLQFPRLRYRMNEGLGVLTVESFDFDPLVPTSAAPAAN